jgi:hypothetical protein
MAITDKSTPVAKPPEVKASLSDSNARDSFIAAALREIVKWQLAVGKVNHDQAGALAVRYGNSAMAIRGLETAPLKVTVAKGMKTIGVDMAIPGTDKTVEAIVDGEKVTPKTIAEIIGDAPELAEVK